MYHLGNVRKERVKGERERERERERGGERAEIRTSPLVHQLSVQTKVSDNISGEFVNKIFLYFTLFFGGCGLIFSFHFPSFMA